MAKKKKINALVELVLIDENGKKKTVFLKSYKNEYKFHTREILDRMGFKNHLIKDYKIHQNTQLVEKY